MSLFDKVDHAVDTVEEKDTVRGQKQAPVPSSVQDLIIKYAYAEKKKTGALFVNVQLEVANGDHKGRFIRLSECVASGDAKGNKTYYEKKQEGGSMKKFDLPGFSLINDLALHVAGKSIVACANEKRTIKLYDFDSKSEKPTEVDMFTELVGKGVRGCVLHRIEDKTAKNAQSGEYEPTGQTYATNVVDKFLSAQDFRTVSEVKNNLSADFKEIWLKKWEGQIDDQSTEVKNAGLKGAPAASGDRAEKTALFG